MDLNTLYATLNNGIRIPRLALGVYQIAEGQETERAVAWAFEAGYRHIDTAAYYKNEASVGAAVRASGLPRSDIFVTTKLKPTDHLHVRRAFERSLRLLDLAYVDLYLIHWPVPFMRARAWSELEALLQEGLCKSIGVSNFTIRHLRELLKTAKVVPAVNQVEMSPFLYQKDLIAFCNERGILIEAYSPLTRGTRLHDPRLEAVARTYGKTPAQVLIRWSLQRGFITLPKSSHKERIVENAAVFDFELVSSDMEALDACNEDYRTCWNPHTMP